MHTSMHVYIAVQAVANERLQKETLLKEALLLPAAQQ
jgi:hypothetical protein